MQIFNTDLKFRMSDCKISNADSAFDQIRRLLVISL